MGRRVWACANIWVVSIPECWCDQSDLLVVNDGMEVNSQKASVSLLTRYGKLLYYAELVPKCLTCWGSKWSSYHHWSLITDHPTTVHITYNYIPWGQLERRRVPDSSWGFVSQTTVNGWNNTTYTLQYRSSFLSSTVSTLQWHMATRDSYSNTPRGSKGPFGWFASRENPRTSRIWWRCRQKLCASFLLPFLCLWLPWKRNVEWDWLFWISKRQ